MSHHYAWQYIMGAELIEAYKALQEEPVNLPVGQTTADYWREHLVETAKEWIGKITYQYGGEGIQVLDPNNPPKNMDCSAFVASLYLTEFGITLPRTTKGQIKQGIPVDREDLKVGDLVFFDWPNKKTGIKDGIVDHVGIYIGNGQYLHEGGEGKSANVKISNLPSNSGGYMTAMRIIQDDGTILNQSKVNSLPQVNLNTTSGEIQGNQNGNTENNTVDQVLYDKNDVYKHEVDLIEKINDINYDKFSWDINNFNKIYNNNKETYERIAKKTGVPAELIAALHYRESGCSFKKYMHNGDPLGKPTVHVPKGKNFDNFEESAIDALLDKKSLIAAYGLTSDSADMAKMMAFAERYNGLGYYNKDRVSPYVYSGTNVYTGGKYVEDGIFDIKTVDKQPGVYMLIQSLIGES